MAARDFSANRLKLRRIYESEVYRQFSYPAFPAAEAVGACRKIEQIYGPFRFPPMPEDRSYTFGSFVMSVDGRIAFPDSPDGTLLAKKNELDPAGGDCDYWILNLLRAASDAVLFGSKSLVQEPYLTGTIYDPDLVELRTAEGKGARPLHVVVTRLGKNLPINHRVFTDPDIPVLIAASAEGAEKIKYDYSDALKYAGNVDSPAAAEKLQLLMNGDLYSSAEQAGKPLLIGLGSGGNLDAGLLLKVLKIGGCHKTLIESPSFLYHLLELELVDEMFLNTSGLCIGGDALTLGRGSDGFSADHHPYTRMLTLHAHSDSFFYSRYKMEYILLHPEIGT